VLFFCIDPEQHEVIEAVTTEITVPPEIEVKVSALRQPEIKVSLLEVDGAIFDDLMLTEEPDLRHWTYHFRFHSHDLEFVSANPGTALQVHGVDVLADFVSGECD
jgi:hypothetical protein